MAINASGLINAGIGIAIAFVVISAVFPVGLESWYDMNLTAMAWDGVADEKTQTFAKLMPFFGMLVVGLMFVGIAKDAV